MLEISLASFIKRIIFLAGLLVILGLAGWFIARIAMGDRLIAVARVNNDYDAATRLKSADAGVRLAPQFSLLQYQQGQLYLTYATGEETEARLQQAIAALRSATSLSPEDYRIWAELGRALDRHGDANEAKQAYAQAVALAPNYYDPHWALGNHLLRNGDDTGAFAEFKRALAIRPTQLPLLFDYAWTTYNGDVAAVIKALEPNTSAKFYFARQLIFKDKAAEGLAMWRELSTESPTQMRIAARDFIDALIYKQLYGPAYEIWRTAAQTPNPNPNFTEEQRQQDMQWFTVNQPEAGSELNNSDFEQDLRIGTIAPFLEWRVYPTKGLSISRNNQLTRSGKFSLQLNFDVGGNVGFVIAEQLIPIKPSTAYRLSFDATTDELQTLSAPLIEIYDPADPKRLRVYTKPFPLGKNPWQEYTLEFTTAAATEALMVRLLRPACGEPPCPILGRIWIDDLKLQPLK